MPLLLPEAPASCGGAARGEEAGGSAPGGVEGVSAAVLPSQVFATKQGITSIPFCLAGTWHRHTPRGAAAELPPQWWLLHLLELGWAAPGSAILSPFFSPILSMWVPRGQL